MVVILLGLAVGVAVAAAINIPQVDSLADFTPSMITQVESHDGEPFAEFARERRILLREGEVPKVLQDAVISVEDSHFFQHGGIDAIGIVRAFATNLRHGERREGASTLTMQLARALYLTPQKKWRRKIQEAFTAVELEKRYSKQQILTLYCNLMNLGHGNYGMAQATRFYFDKDISELEIHEAAMLAGIPQRPSDYSPYRREELVEKRRNHVLRRMFAEGYITQEEFDAALAEPLGVVPRRPPPQVAPYFAEDIRKTIESTYGTTAMLEGGLQVRTTLDLEIQASAEHALRQGVGALDRRKGWRGAEDNISAELETARQENDPIAAVAELVGRVTDENDPRTLDPLEPERWYQGVVMEVSRERAQVRIGETDCRLLPAGVRWTRRRTPDRVLEVGDVAWFRLAADEDEGLPSGGPEEGAAPVVVLEQQPELQGAVVVLESATGAVRAMVGGWDFDRSKFNRITQAKRQVGSSFKLFVWAAALEGGFSAADTLFDAPTYFLGADNTPTYRPRNYSRNYYGITTLRRAMEQSLNLTAVKLQDMVGTERVIETAHRFGVESELAPYPSLALGVADLTPLELAASYAAVANQGTWVRPYFIESVTDPRGRVLQQHVPETRFATSPEVAFVLTHILRGIPTARGTAPSLRTLDLDIAGKTGTTDDFSDAWFVGFTPRYTLLTWVGYDQRRPIGRGMTGNEAAVPIWRALLEDGKKPRIFAEPDTSDENGETSEGEDQEPEPGWIDENLAFTPPPGITMTPIELRSGLLPSGVLEETVLVEAFVRGTEPGQTYDERWNQILELPWYQQRPFYLPKEAERMPDDFEDVARVDDWTGKDDN